ncbi:complement factor D-like [Dermacentor silvarum]|uniref:complement factor D-like n=1 Tax=Dermacentor silvarum TaxID=543639 RepID=UPI002101BFEC|nr:complement factor D-like [Dermacentor silvarum]
MPTGSRLKSSRKQAADVQDLGVWLCLSQELPPRLPHSELPWSRVAPGVSTEACDSAPGSADRLYWLRNGQRLPPPTPDRFWEPGAYLCVREGNRTVSLQRALLVTEEDDGGLCTAGLPTDEDRSRPALIAQRWALTAAHCLPERSDTQLAVLLGATRQSGPRIGVLRAVPHPDYVRGTPSREHDVALLLLERRAERLTVACLPPAGGYLERFSQGVLFGWGRVGPRGGPALKLQRHRSFCAGFGEAYRADACEGDSGGPWSDSWTGDPCSWASSAGGTRARGPSPSACTRAWDSYLAWIRGHVTSASVD